MIRLSKSHANTAKSNRSGVSVRDIVVFVHRYLGLLMALFLLLVGSTGSLLVWEQELDVALNRDLLLNQTSQPHLPPDELLEQLKSQYPDVSFGFSLFHRDTRRSAVIYVSNWQSDSDTLMIDQIFVDRATAAVLGGRNSFEPSFSSRKEIVPWIMKFHWSLTLSWGATVLGIVALLWLFDCLVAWYLTLPKRFSWRRWKQSWQIKSKRLNFDLHRALSLWLLPAFMVLALSSIYFNLNTEVFKPVLKLFTEVTTKPYEDPELYYSDYHPRVSFTEGLAIARTELEKRQVTETGVAYLSYNANRGYYLFGFYSVDDIARDTTDVQVYISSTGKLLQFYHVGAGTAGDIITDWQFPLHSGQAFGIVGRLIIFLAGIALCVISVTGVVIWWRKLQARRSVKSKTKVPLADQSKALSKPRDSIKVVDV